MKLLNYRNYIPAWHYVSMLDSIWQRDTISHRVREESCG